MGQQVSDLLGLVFKFPVPWILTGAGISTESGIPDFRSPGTGLWEKLDPMEFSSVEGLTRNPKAFFTYGMESIGTVLRAEPNTGHLVLGNLQQTRLIGPIVTQNIDDLHRRGGANHFYEVHGHVRTGTCMNCRNQVLMSEITAKLERGEIPPLCGYCAGILKPDIVLFGDMMPADYQEASLLASRYQTVPKLMIVIGSSLTVAPINHLPLEFNRLVIINNTPTYLDYKADLVIEEQIGRVMGGLWQEILQLNGGTPPEPIPYGFNFGGLVGYLDNEMRFLRGQQGRMTVSRESLARHIGYIKADIEATRSIIGRFSTANRQALEKFMLQYYVTEIDKMENELYSWSSETGVVPQSENPRIGKLLQDLFKESVTAFTTYAKQTYPVQDISEIMAARAVGCFGFWSMGNQILGLPAPPAKEIERFKQVARENRVKRDLDEYRQLFQS